MNTDAFIARLVAAKIAWQWQIVGCTAEEIARVELAAGRPLPATYRRFLEVMGRGAGHFMADLDVFYPRVLDLTEWAKNRLSGGPVLLPDNAFVFCSRRQEQFFFFEVDGASDDPPIYYWIEDEDDFEYVANSVWDVFESELEVAERLGMYSPQGAGYFRPLINADAVFDRLVDGLIVPPSQIVGCTKEEIAQVEVAVGHPLPFAYYRFLEVMGRGAGPVLADWEVFYPHMLGLTAWARGRLSQTGLRLAESAVVFCRRGEDEFLFFVADGTSADPPVQRWSKGADDFAYAAASIWEFLALEVATLEQKAAMGGGTV